MKKISWGIIGLGNMALQFADAFKYVKNASLKAISSKNLHKLNNFREKFNIEPNYCFSDYQELINCKDIDIIYIALPHSCHYDWTAECIFKDACVGAS